MKIKIEDSYGNIVYSSESNNKQEHLVNARKLITECKNLANKYKLPIFVVTDGASGTSNNGSEIVEKHRKFQIDWEKENGFDPDEDWDKQKV